MEERVGEVGLQLSDFVRTPGKLIGGGHAQEWQMQLSNPGDQQFCG
jgi:hypothetical protein